MPLRRPRHIEGTIHQKILAPVVNWPHLLRIGILPTPITLQRIIRPGIPQLEDRLHEFIGPAVAFGMGGHGCIAVITRLHIKHGGHHIPAHATAGDMVERRHLTGRMKRVAKVLDTVLIKPIRSVAPLMARQRR